VQRWVLARFFLLLLCTPRSGARCGDALGGKCLLHKWRQRGELPAVCVETCVARAAQGAQPVIAPLLFGGRRAGRAFFFVANVGRVVPPRRTAHPHMARVRCARRRRQQPPSPRRPMPCLLPPLLSSSSRPLVFSACLRARPRKHNASRGTSRSTHCKLDSMRALNEYLRLAIF
jgi:hypothetical protein